MSTLTKRDGDIRAMWKHDDPDDVAEARAQFDRLRKQGYLAYRAEGKHGDRGEVIREFDPKAERIIFVKRSVGG
jgi:hypothetical protein